MWKKQDDAVGAQPDLSSKETPDLASLGDALVESLMNEQVKKANFAVVPQKVLAQDQPLPIPTMKTYTEAMNEFTKNATAVLEQLPLLTKARAAYEEARRASAEMRKLLDSGDQKLQTLMTRLEQGVNVPGVQPAPDKKNPEPARVDRIRGSDEGRGPAIRWP